MLLKSVDNFSGYFGHTQTDINSSGHNLVIGGDESPMVKLVCAAIVW